LQWYFHLLCYFSTSWQVNQQGLKNDEGFIHHL
jgi:hypothetical protein